jgi:hypothetical protein
MLLQTDRRERLRAAVSPPARSSPQQRTAAVRAAEDWDRGERTDLMLDLIHPDVLRGAWSPRDEMP